jgi:kynurenine formamidase
MSRLVDLSISITADTPLPPPVRRRNAIEVVNFPAGGALQGSWLTIYSHTGSHVDAPLHVVKGTDSIGEVPLEAVIGEAVVIDLTHLGARAQITPEVLQPHANDIRPGDIVVLRTDWTDKKWPADEYWMDSPYLTEEGARWLAERRPKAVAVDFLEEWASRLVDVTAEDFVADRALLGRGILLIKGLTGIGKLRKRRVQLFAAPVKFAHPVEGAPARIFAVEDD